MALPEDTDGAPRSVDVAEVPEGPTICLPVLARRGRIAPFTAARAAAAASESELNTRLSNRTRPSACTSARTSRPRYVLRSSSGGRIDPAAIRSPTSIANASGGPGGGSIGRLSGTRDTVSPASGKSSRARARASAALTSAVAKPSSERESRRTSQGSGSGEKSCSTAAATRASTCVAAPQLSQRLRAQVLALEKG
jgi:hypothetical protein